MAWINRLSSLARVGHMIDLVEERARDAIEVRRRAPFFGGRTGALSAGALISSRATGYVQNIDPDMLESAAGDRDCRIEIIAVPGSFVRRGDPLARISLAACDEAAHGEFCAAFAIGGSRSYDHDPRFGLIVLGEIAAKALSPAVNDPGTAVQVIGSGVRLLDLWLEERDEVKDGRAVSERILAPPITEAELLEDIFGPIARYGAHDVPVSVRLLKALGSLAETSGPMRTPAREMAKEVVARARHALPIAADIARVRAIKV